MQGNDDQTIPSRWRVPIFPESYGGWSSTTLPAMGREPPIAREIHVETNVEREAAHCGRWVRWTVLLVALIASCKESTAPPTASAPVAASIHAIGGNTLTDTIGAAETLIVYVFDGSGGPVSGVPVTFSIGASRGSVSPSAVRTDQTGRATTKWTLGTKDGSSGDIDSVVAVTSAPFLSIARYATVTAGAPAALKIYSGDSLAGFLSSPSRCGRM